MNFRELIHEGRNADDEYKLLSKKVDKMHSDLGKALKVMHKRQTKTPTHWTHNGSLDKVKSDLEEILRFIG